MRRLLPLVAWLTTAVPAPASSPVPPPVTAVAYHPSGKVLAAGTGGEVRLFDPATGQPLRADKPTGSHEPIGSDKPTGTGSSIGPVRVAGRITALAYDPGGQYLAVAAGDAGKSGVVHLFRCRDGGRPEAGTAVELAGHTDAVYALAFSPNGQTLATAGYDRLIHLWKLPAAPGAKPDRTLRDHSDTIYALAFRPDGLRLASASADRSVKVWDPATGQRLHTLRDSTDWVYTVAWNPRTGQLAAGGVDKALRVWELTADGGKLVRAAFAHEKPIGRIAFSPDGDRLFTVGEDGVLKTWDAAKLTEGKTFPAQPDLIHCLAVRPDGRQLAIGRHDGALVLLDAATGNPTAPPPPTAEPTAPPPPAAEPAPAQPRPPQPAKVTPDGAVRGATTRVVVTGTGLAPGVSVSADIPGLTVRSVAASPTGDRLELDVTAPANAAPVLGKLVFAGEGGTASLPFAVDRFPTTDETSSNDSVRTAPVVTLPVTLRGSLDRTGDTDYLRFVGKTGDEVGLQVVTAAAAGRFDPVLTVSDSAGTILAEGGAVLGFRVPKDGVYAVGLRDREYRGGVEFAYRLHAGPVPVVTSVFPLAVRRGQTSPVQVEGVNIGPRTPLSVPVSVPGDAPLGSRVPVPVTVNGEAALGSPAVVVSEFDAVVIDPRTGADLQVPGSADGLLARPRETPTVRFPARRGERLVVEVLAQRAGSPVDPVIEVLDAAGRPLPRARLRAIAKTYTSFRDHDSASPGIRLESWNDLAIDDYLFGGGELLRILALPRNPDDDCQFYQVGGKRLGFLGTTPTHHALGVPLYKVEVHPPDATFPPNGLPTFLLYYRNDDGGPGYGKDAFLLFDPPADGTYQVRVSDARGAYGPSHAFRLTVRPPRPDYTVSFTPSAPAVWRSGGVPVTVTVNRIDGFDGPVRVRFDGLPEGFSAPETTVEAGQTTTALTLSATAEAVTRPKSLTRLVATARIDGKDVVREASGGELTLRSGGDLAARTRQAAVVIRPGQETRFVVDVERRDGFSGRVPLEVRGLPHGVRVLNVGLNGILITERETSREIALYCEPWVTPTERPVVVLARSEKAGTEHAAPPLILRVLATDR
jgi:WD40 repeat protein